MKMQLVSRFRHTKDVLQLCDVGMNKSMKPRLKKDASDWRRERHDALKTGENMLCLKRKDISHSTKKICDQFR